MKAKFLRAFYATLLVVAAVALLPGQSQATWFDLTASDPLVNDYIDWAQLGPAIRSYLIMSPCRPGCMATVSPSRVLTHSSGSIKEMAGVAISPTGLP